MNSRAGLVPVVITDKNNVTGVRWKKPAETAASHSRIPAVNVTPQYTYADVISELETLGVVFEGSTTPNAVKLLAKYDHVMLHRIMTAVRENEPASRSVWRETLGLIAPKDITRRGKDIAIVELARMMPQFKRLLAINPIDAQIMDTGNNFRSFWNLNHATFIENEIGIAPGDPGYKLVQANVIHVFLTRPNKYSPETVRPYLQDHHDDIIYIAEHLDDTIRLIPELHERKDASRGTIEAMLGVSHVLVEGAL